MTESKEQQMTVSKEQQMTESKEQQMTESKNRIMTGFIHYDESDDLTKLFDTLNEFRINNGLKYSHQSRSSMVFFNISSEYLDLLSKVRPFKISRFQSSSKYNCDNEICNILMGQKDSFIRMIWDEETKLLTFLSRTPSSVHGGLVRRIFRDSGVEFQKDNYEIIRKFTKKNPDSLDVKHNDSQDISQNFSKENKKHYDSKVKYNNKSYTKFQQNKQNQSINPTINEFQNVESKRTMKIKTNMYPNQHNLNSKIEKEFKPKVRGAKNIQSIQNSKHYNSSNTYNTPNPNVIPNPSI
jgi:hypothetical protein